MKGITPCLWFDTQAEEAARFYTSVFPKAKMGNVTRYGENMPRPAGTVMTATIELDGQELMLLNGGPEPRFNMAVSFMVYCETQEEIDLYWSKLTADGGQEVECGWLTDKYGLSWQIVPAVVADMLDSKDPVRIGRFMQAIMTMKKLDKAALERAFEGA
jgi:predicted 3-demethylubiquinone-9 3-methyltransferase (glyoxalase superfamily)